MPLSIFSAWKDKPLEEVFIECREILEDPGYPTISRWRDAGGKVVGHFQVYFPEEIVHAAGMLPFKVKGSPMEAVQADSHFGSYLCSILKTSLELELGEHISLDMFVTHPICDAARNLAAIWGRNFDYPCQILYLPQNANSIFSAKYLKNEYDRLKRDIEAVAGKEITDQNLMHSLQIFNENRALLREIYAIKQNTPWLLSVYEAYLVMAVGCLIPREEHNKMLRTIIPMIYSRDVKKQDKIRVVFEGGFCEQPPLDMIRTISQSCYIVDDDLLIGLRYILEDIPTDGDDLLYNLAEAYLENSTYSPVQHDLRKPKEKMLLQRIQKSNAEAAIITAAKMCEPGLEEQVAYTYELEIENIPYFVSEFEENMTSFDHLEIQLETFVENLIFD